VLRRAIGIVLVVLAPACAGTKPSETKPPPTKTADVKDAGGGEADAAPPERPFAGSIAEATQLISQAVDKKALDVQRCIDGYRARKHLEHQRVDISVGIDQEGHLLGVTSKGNKDAELSSCVQAALKSAPFPRSHSGVITVTRTYEELVQ
jgi:hypothetical protein